MRTLTSHPRYVLLAALTVGFGVLATAVQFGVTQMVDDGVLLAINGASNFYLNVFFSLITELGGVIVLTCATLLVIVTCLSTKRYRYALFTALVMGGSLVANLIFKTLFERVRPELWDQLIVETSHSFPSGHATASMAFALLIVLLISHRTLRKVALVLGALYIVLIGLSRMYLGVHYPTDVLGGWILGAAWVLVAMTIMNIRYRPLSTKKEDV